jgi:hypothetical protein
MSFILLFYLGVLLCIMFFKYKNLYTVTAAIMFLFTTTTAAFIYSLSLFKVSSVIRIFESNLPQIEFFYLIAGWYLVDIIATIRVIRTYKDYKEVNSPSV